MQAFLRRIPAGRPLLLIALGLFVLSQFMPVYRIHVGLLGHGEDAEIVEEASRSWVGFWNMASLAFQGTFPSQENLLLAVVFLAFVLPLLVAPFAAPFLARARPLLWTARIFFFLLFAAMVVVDLKQVHLIASTGSGMSIDHLSGFWTLLASLLLYFIALMLIPKPDRALPFLAADGMTHE